MEIAGSIVAHRPRVSKAGRQEPRNTPGLEHKSRWQWDRDSREEKKQGSQNVRSIVLETEVIQTLLRVTF